jgi:carboxypeptidase Q
VRLAELTAAAALSFALSLPAAALAAPKKAAAEPLPLVQTAMALRDDAMKGGSIGVEFTRDLTTRFGARPAGSASEAAAAEWAAARMKALGFENVSVQPFRITSWSRGQEHAEITGPSRQSLAAVSLGEAPPTPAGGIEAEIVLFRSLEELMAAPDGSLTGKIAVVSRRMVRMQDGSGYGPITRIRGAGPGIAAKKGALAFVLRSAGTDNHRMGHTGTTRYENGKVAIPAFAMSNPDADQIERLAALGPVRLKLVSGASYDPNATSHNVIAEIRGREKPEEVILIGAHLDSWDLGTGAIDDAAGAGIVTGAADLIRRLPQRPRRTIRVVLFGSEEVAQPDAPFGTFGGWAYANANKAALEKHVVAGESDFGADKIYSINLPAGAMGTAFAAHVETVLAPIGVLMRPDSLDDGGADIGPSVNQGVPVFALNQDGTRYFDLHHTADDTFDKIDPAQLDQNVAAWAGLLWLIADSDVDFRALAKAAPAPAAH